MQKTVLSIAAVFITAMSFAAPSQASYYSDDCQPRCYIRKIKSYDYYGNLLIRKVRICD